jgi:quercetin dioxygenase-like cupin family protein
LIRSGLSLRISDLSGAAIMIRQRPYALSHGEGNSCHCGVEFTVKASEMATGSGAAVLEYTTVKGEEPPDHTHPTEDEMFYVLEGEITFRCAGESFPLKKGGFAFLPRGIEHGYTINSDTPVRLLVVTSPIREAVSGGWGGFVGEMENGQAAG